MQGEENKSFTEASDGNDKGRRESVINESHLRDAAGEELMK